MNCLFNCESVTGYKIRRDVIAVTIKPLYNAPIIFLLLPNLTNHVPIIEVKIQAPPIAKDKSSNYNQKKKIEDKTIVATIVTA